MPTRLVKICGDPAHLPDNHIGWNSVESEKGGIKFDIKATAWVYNQTPASLISLQAALITQN